MHVGVYVCACVGWCVHVGVYVCACVGWCVHGGDVCVHACVLVHVSTACGSTS